MKAEGKDIFLQPLTFILKLQPGNYRILINWDNISSVVAITLVLA
jgi:hypothetical protein